MTILSGRRPRVLRNRPDKAQLTLQFGDNPTPHLELSGSDTDAATIRECYESGTSIGQLAKQSGVNPKAMKRRLQAAGVAFRTRSQARRLYRINEHAFDTITEDSAYWIGFLMADGCITREGKGAMAIKVVLSVTDEGHLRSLLAFLGSNHPIHYAEVVLDGEEHHSCFVEIRSKILVGSLMRFGVKPRKSKTAEVHHLEMNRDFWRGVIDGDGCLYLDEKQSPFLKLWGSERLVTQFIEFAVEHATECRSNACFNDGVYTFQCGKQISFQLIDVLYRGCKIALPRKKSTADFIIANPDLSRDKRLKWAHLTPEVLEGQYHRLGSWEEVARSNEMPYRTLIGIRYRRKLQARRQSQLV